MFWNVFIAHWGLLKTPVLLNTFIFHLTSSVAYRDLPGIRELRARALKICCVITTFYASQRTMEDCFASVFWLCFCAEIWSEALALFHYLSLLISLHRPYSNCFLKRIFNLFQTAKVSLDFKRLFASLNDKWINSERELWRWKQAGNKWRSTCLNCKSKNWHVFNMLFKQFRFVTNRGLLQTTLFPFCQSDAVSKSQVCLFVCFVCPLFSAVLMTCFTL